VVAARQTLAFLHHLDLKALNARFFVVRHGAASPGGLQDGAQLMAQVQATRAATDRRRAQKTTRPALGWCVGPSHKPNLAT
jgi:hypothetical protein